MKDQWERARIAVVVVAQALAILAGALAIGTAIAADDPCEGDGAPAICLSTWIPTIDLLPRHIVRSELQIGDCVTCLWTGPGAAGAVTSTSVGGGRWRMMEPSKACLEKLAAEGGKVQCGGYTCFMTTAEAQRDSQ